MAIFIYIVVYWWSVLRDFPSKFQTTFFSCAQFYYFYSFYSFISSLCFIVILWSKRSTLSFFPINSLSTLNPFNITFIIIVVVWYFNWNLDHNFDLAPRVEALAKLRVPEAVIWSVHSGDALLAMHLDVLRALFAERGLRVVQPGFTRSRYGGCSVRSGRGFVEESPQRRHSPLVVYELFPLISMS